MPWVRLDEDAIDHPKLVALSDGAFRLWCEALAYCQKHLTDGFIPLQALTGFRYYSAARLRDLTREHVPGKGPCWVRVAAGIEVHDYLDWNDSRAVVLESRAAGGRRAELLRQPELRRQVRERDGDVCRYCGVTVAWSDRRGPTGGTYDHVTPALGTTLDNVVVSCRQCKGRKRGLSGPGEAGLVLRSGSISRIGSRSDLSEDLSTTSGVEWSDLETQDPSKGREGGVGETMTPPAPPSRPDDADTRACRAGAFCRWYADKHEELFGVAYIGNPRKDYERALDLVAKFSDDQLRDAALVWFGMRDAFAVTGTRSIPKFASRASACVQIVQEQLA